MSKKIYVGNLAYEVQEEELRDTFTKVSCQSNFPLSSLSSSGRDTIHPITLRHCSSAGL